MEKTTTYSKPVGSMMRPIPRIWASASVGAAANEIRDSGLPAVGVTEGFIYVAVVTQESLASALARGAHPDDPVERAYDLNAPTLPPYAPGERALELLTEKNAAACAVVDDYGRLMGLLTPADLFPKRDRAPRPAAVGGMATPFGVYLTTGSIGAGATGWPLVITGMTLFTIMTLIGLGVDGLQSLATTEHLRVPDYVFGGLLGLLFLLAFRVMPLSGIHAAEHKVVHAIERGEELTRENVRRMPRVHPRCGTNLAVGASIFTLLGAAAWLIPDVNARYFAALIGTLIFWRPIGALVQKWFTTKEPTDKQIDMGIRSGQELLRKYATGRGGRQGLGWRLWNTGLFHVIAGASIMFVVLSLIEWLVFHQNPLTS